MIEEVEEVREDRVGKGTNKQTNNTSDPFAILKYAIIIHKIPCTPRASSVRGFGVRFPRASIIQEAIQSKVMEYQRHICYGCGNLASMPMQALGERYS